jgi:hypothetical protein
MILEIIITHDSNFTEFSEIQLHETYVHVNKYFRIVHIFSLNGLQYGAN